MKKILFVVNDLKMGGVTTSLLYLLRELEKYDVQADVLNLSIKSSQFDLDIKTIPLKNIVKYWVLPSNALKYEKGVLNKSKLIVYMIFKKVLRKRWQSFIVKTAKPVSGYDIAVAYRQSESSLRFVLEMINAKKKFAFIHGNIEYLPKFDKWKNYLLEYDKVICVAERLKKDLENKLTFKQNQVDVIYNLLDMSRIYENSMKPINPEIHKFLFDRHFDGLTFVTIARISKLKGIDRIIQICKNLNNDFKLTQEYRWLIIGGGEDLFTYKKEAEEMGVANNIFFLGEMKNPFPILKNANLYISTSISEGYPMVVLEAKLLNIPPLVAEYPAAAEQITNNVDGVIVANSVESLTEKISEIIMNPQQLIEIKENMIKIIPNNNVSLHQIETIFEIY